MAEISHRLDKTINQDFKTKETLSEVNLNLEEDFKVPQEEIMDNKVINLQVRKILIRDQTNIN